MFVFSGAIKRNFASGTRNKSTNWIGRHKEPLTEQQRLRRVNKHAPFVLGRDNVVQNYAPTVMNITESNQKPYKVLRTTNGYLPVYHDYKSARSQIITIIRRIEGDIEVNGYLIIGFKK